MADNKPQPPSWIKIREVLETNDADKIAELKRDLDIYVERSARRYYLQRLAISSILAATLGQILFDLKANENDPVALFKKQSVYDFASAHGFTIYTDVKQIQPGDTIIQSWTYKDKKDKGKTKTSRSTLRVLEPQEGKWLVTLSMYENCETQFEAHKRTEEITKKNFVIGVHPPVPPIMKEPQKFYFINFPD